MANKFTPGPWRAIAPCKGREYYGLQNAAGKRIAKSTGVTITDEWNMLLAAAAPDLLAVSGDVAEYLARFQSEEAAIFVGRLRAAISKAT
jgi:hypothetical protein